MTDRTAPVRELIQAFNDRDFDRATMLYARTYVNHAPLPIAAAGAPNDGTRGIRGLADTLPDSYCEIVQCVQKGELVVLHTSVEGHNMHGDLVSAEFMTVFRVENGLIQESWGLVDPVALMRRLGLALEPTANPAGN
jgi:predicted SnoaL-like aldol condensation-catalyzing enzyme